MTKTRYIFDVNMFKKCGSMGFRSSDFIGRKHIAIIHHYI